MVPREWAGYQNGQVVWLDVPIQQLLPYYRFIRSHPEIYTETTSLAKTAVLYSMAAAQTDPQSYEREYRAVCKLLYDAHRQFDVILVGDGRWNTAEPSAAQLGRYHVILVLGPQQLRDETVDRLVDWKTGTRKLVLGGKTRSSQPGYSRLCAAALGRPVPPAELPSFVPYLESRDADSRRDLEEAIGPDGLISTNAPADVGIQVWQAGGRTFLHVINYGYDKDADRVRDVRSIELRLSLPTTRPRLLSPDDERERVLPLQHEKTGVRLVLPGLHIYSVLDLN